MKIVSITKPILIACFLVMSFSVFAQSYLSKEGILIEADITEEQRDAIYESTDIIFNEYIRTATFRDENEQFSDDTYAEFVGLFAGSAEVYNDLLKKDAQNINYASYADKVYQYLSGGGVNFEINEAYIDKITYDSSGFYKVEISFEKIMYNGLNEDNQAVSYPNKGRLLVLKMTTEIPEYDLSQAQILNVLGEAKKVKTESETILGLDGNYHLGNVLLTESTLVRSDGFLKSQKVDYNSYGADLTYRRSLNSKKSMFLLAGVSVGFHSFTTSLSDFQGTGTDVLDTRTGGKALDGTGADNPIATFEVTETTFRQNGDNVISEELNVVDIQVPLGVSFRVIEEYNWDFFVDLAVVPTYLISSSGQYDGNVSVVEFPKDENVFSQEFKDHVLANADNPFYSEYYTDVNFTENVEAVSNFTASAQITPMIHYKFNYKLGLSFGLNVNYNFLPYFKSEDIGEWESEDTQLLNTVGDGVTRNPSVLQANYKSASILRYGARIGVIFKL